MTEPRRVVALRYDAERRGAPRVTAKGGGTLAERILALAQDHGVPLHEDHDLVRLLSVLELDVEIPPRCYQALAEILAHLYRTNQRYGAKLAALRGYRGEP